MKSARTLILLTAIAVSALSLAACGNGDDDAPAPGGGATPGARSAGENEPFILVDSPDSYAPQIDSANFVGRIDNPYLPFVPGSRWVYESADGSERIEVTVLDETREVLGITATIVRDTVTENGALVEDTYDWYAQDREGNVWYLGEDSTEYEDGEPVSTAGSWEAGVDGALPGIAMLAEPAEGTAYRQEFYRGEAEDIAEVIRTGEIVTIRLVEYSGVIVTKEWTPLEPDVAEHKYYAPGIGSVHEVKVAGEEGEVDLVSFEPA